MQREIGAAAEWMSERVSAVRFGAVTVRVVIHDGSIAYVERETAEKTKPTGKAGAPNADRC